MKLNFIIPSALFFIGHSVYAANICVPEPTNQDATEIIQNALNHCQNNVVQLRTGTWFSGPLNLPSNTTLKLDKNSILKANKQKTFKAAYIQNAAQAGEALLFASHAHNIRIMGEGTIDGQGQSDWATALRLKQQMSQGNYTEFQKLFPNVPPSNGMPRPWLFEFDHVQNSSIDGVKFINSPMWTVVIRNSNDIQVKNVSVYNPPSAPNTDGIDIVSSKNIRLSNVDITTDDDNIAIKSGLTKTALGAVGMSENIDIDRASIGVGHGISIGSETVYGIRNVKISNVNFQGTDNGIRIKSARDRGNIIENISAENIKMDRVTYPIVFTSLYSSMTGGYDKNFLVPIAKQAVTSTTPIMRNISIRRLTATNAVQAGLISGLPESPIRNVSLQDVRIEADNGLQNRYAIGSLRNVMIFAKHSASTQNGPQPNLKAN
ncbi:glycoside hydrolase family 28 protein [Acinetobacter sp. MD2]|uniref:glycoside hydrolase family 28 protein n=1 Tax=Acinetobacter sp. MD2 TaxID=2600066 RepID=UPI002D1F0CB4|nr:glycosyl hydrolase family 28 protein [Acinetobacter sp. MD2]MEB3767742.1 glycoside hydrolase [Acinetobacter sp. MD2]